MSWRRALGAALVIALALAALLADVQAWRECHAAGGVLLRGVLSFECVRPEITRHAPR